MTLAVDYSFNHPPVGSIRAAGYAGVIRYLSPDTTKSTKNLTPVERDALHGAGLWILLVWEAWSGRALSGAPAGDADGLKAAEQATALGYPASCPIFWAVDFQVTPAQMPTVKAYGQAFERHWLGGPYGSKLMVESVTSPWRWQAAAWSGAQVSLQAALYQRLKPTRPLLGSFDENVVLKPDLPVWAAQTPVDVVIPVQRPAPGPRLKESFMLFQDSTGIFFLTGAGTVHVPTVPDVQALQTVGVPLVQISDDFGATLRGTP
jgi:hypothetical protein